MSELTDAAKDREIAALMEERRGYVVHGRDARVAEVDAQLALRGVKPPDSKPAERSTATPKRRARTAD